MSDDSDLDDGTFDEDAYAVNLPVACEALAELAETRWRLTERGDDFRASVFTTVDALDLATPIPASEVRAMATTERMLDGLLLEWVGMPDARSEVPSRLYAEVRRATRRAAKVEPATKPVHPIPEGADYAEWLDDLRELHLRPARDALAAEAAWLWKPTFDWTYAVDAEWRDADAGDFINAVAEVVEGLDLARPLLLRDIHDLATRPEVLKALVKRWRTYDTFLESAPPEALWLAFVDDLDPEVLEHFTVDGEPVKRLLAVTLKGNPFADRYTELME
ncbi:hypothetical protein [Mycolicibacterium fortuitum]|uniref:hypothetical protein n=1 Tax=Mycolicibacterium fortuitum TaxID=1766 RepID=UPI001CDCACFF|nr:hypothetical protein [Mycolicibacterium fortuitum]UBV14991.1 hypothetical protein H8Z57_30635 [Mycolicibacterium fortuitum]